MSYTKTAHMGGRWVRLRTDLRTLGGTQFKAGEVLLVSYVERLSGRRYALHLRDARDPGRRLNCRRKRVILLRRRAAPTTPNPEAG